MDYVTLNDFKSTSDYQDFINKNQGTGVLKIMAFTAYQGMPINNVEISITKNINGNEVLFFNGKTDANGIIDNIILPAPLTNVDNEEVPERSVYRILSHKNGFVDVVDYPTYILDNIKSIQYIKMNPNFGGNNANSL